MTTMQQQYYYATGRRKSAIAQVRLYMENGPVIVNGKPIEEAFPWDNWRREIMEPFRITHSGGQFRVVAKVTGGGVTGQAGALRHGISRALIEADPSLRTPLKRAGNAHPRSSRQGATQVRPEESPQGTAVHQALVAGQCRESGSICYLSLNLSVAGLFYDCSATNYIHSSHSLA